jgi:hypothetical protein
MSEVWSSLNAMKLTVNGAAVANAYQLRKVLAASREAVEQVLEQLPPLLAEILRDVNTAPASDQLRILIESADEILRYPNPIEQARATFRARSTATAAEERAGSLGFAAHESPRSLTIAEPDPVSVPEVDDAAFFEANTNYFNCYAYAVGDRSDPDKVVPSIPGAAGGAPMKQLSIDDLRRGLEQDGAIPANAPKDRLPPHRPGFRLIAAVLSPSGQADFHFYRQEADGRWTHKPARSSVTDKDASGEIITDPRTANRDYRDVPINGLKWDLNYASFDRFYYVPLSGLRTGKAAPPAPLKL